MRTPLLVLSLVLAAGLHQAAHAELTEGDFKRARSAVSKHLRTPGELTAKGRTISTLEDDDSARSALLLVKWAVGSLKWQAGELKRTRDKAQSRFDKLLKILRKAYDRMPPSRREDRNEYDRLKTAVDQAEAHIAIEDSVQRKITGALAALRSPEAVEALLAGGEKRLLRAKRSGRVWLGVLRAYLATEPAAVTSRMLEIVGSRLPPSGRILALNWISRFKPAGGLDATLAALSAKEDAVRRSAVFTLRILDDPACVEPMIRAIAKARGLFSDELDAALYYFTGQTFDGEGSLWRQWWEQQGETWETEHATERHGDRPPRGGGSTSFYGVETKSKRIVFVLDRSGSMQKKALPDRSKPRGPITGEGADGENAHIKGDTKIEVAKSQLVFSIRNLATDVHFAIVFYSNEIEVWQAAPKMVQATPENKARAIKWIEDIEAVGSTRTFDALLEALAYARQGGGANTIFLLSDGSPTVRGGGDLLVGDDLEREYEAFLEQNRIYKCVVHTIGVGRSQNRGLMRRIAKDGRGIYRSVGDGN